jgi:quaternary ammonium compound-resistance protein SugE
MNWILLVIAGLFEMVFATCLGKAKLAVGNAVYYWYAGFIFALIISMALLTKATQSIPIGTAYAVWTGIGAIGTAVIGMLILKEPASFWRMFFILSLIASVIGLKAVSG